MPVIVSGSPFPRFPRLVRHLVYVGGMLFPARIRYSGLSPFVAVFLLAEYNSPWPVAAYMAGMAGMALLSVLCTLSLRELKTA